MTAAQLLHYAEALRRCAEHLVAARATVGMACITARGVHVAVDDPGDLPQLLDQRRQAYPVQEDNTHLPRIEGVCVWWDQDAQRATKEAA